MASVGTRTVRWVVCAAAVVFLCGAASGTAQAQVNTGKLSFSAGIDFTNAYFFRGLKQENEGFISQPYAELTASFFDAPDAQGLTAVSFTIGGWNSLHTGPTGSDGPTFDPDTGLLLDRNVRSWYESDLYTGLALTIDNWETGVTYTSYMSPNQSFKSIQELSISLAMDDSAWLGAFSMAPHVLLAIELRNQADNGDSEGVYLELGVEPGLDVVDGNIGLTFPITLGLSLSNYYENGMPVAIPADDGTLADAIPTFSDGFGFFSLGAAVGVPLAIMGDNYGSWELTGSFQLLALGSYLEFLNDDNGTEFIAAIGVSIGY